MITLQPDKKYTVKEIEKLLSDETDPMSVEFVQEIFDRYIMEEYMSKLGYLFDPSNMTFVKFTPNKKDINYLVCKLEKERPSISSSGPFQQLKLIINTMTE